MWVPPSPVSTSHTQVREMGLFVMFQNVHASMPLWSTMKTSLVVHTYDDTKLDGTIHCVSLSNAKECGHSARCLLLPDGDTLALDAWGHIAVETGDVRHLSPSTVTGVAIVHLRADGPALIKGMRGVRLQLSRGIHIAHTHSNAGSYCKRRHSSIRTQPFSLQVRPANQAPRLFGD